MAVILIYVKGTEEGEYAKSDVEIVQTFPLISEEEAV
ncbi:hypothetical protein SDC9_150438 [bioreactor metagenome]|uniref:Uncharacterized protein n=1 Tax=bioreactor metagenome TaxID=1076179 RepID=A0A645EPL6_9ZZZZ